MTNKKFRNYDTYKVYEFIQSDAKFRECFEDGVESLDHNSGLWDTMNRAFESYFARLNNPIAWTLVYSSLNNVDWEEILTEFGYQNYLV